MSTIGHLAAFCKTGYYYRMASCYHCAQVFPADFKVFRTTECPSCGKDVKVCRNCAHYSPGSHWDCRESISDQVTDKERSNFCDWFRLNTTPGSGTQKPAAGKSEQARAGFAALFGDDENSIP